MPANLYARFSNDQPNKQQLLEAHLEKVRNLGLKLAKNQPPLIQEGVNLVSYLHDLGKASQDFQTRLETKRQNLINGQNNYVNKAEHSIYGAKYITEHYPKIGYLLAYAIAGHHAGLANCYDESSSCLKDRLEKTNDIPTIPFTIPKFICEQDFLGLLTTIKDKKFGLSFYSRLLFSYLVDADRLNSENFDNPENTTLRENQTTLPLLLEKFRTYIDNFKQAIPSNLSEKTKLLNQKRVEIYDACLKASSNPTGLFSLTVPTGGGKTLSSMAFALNHAVKNQQERIIYVAPLMSIIDQTATIYKNIFGEDNVLSHYSSNDFVKKAVDSAEWVEDRKALLSTENWDAPVIVTTAVQFWESLFTHTTKGARKVHNMLNAVIIFDEVQTIPIKYLHPCLATMKELVAYKSTLVLCTATQPALNKRDKFGIGLENIKEIIDNPTQLAKFFDRVKLTNLGLLSDDDLTSRLSKHHQVLCIVNTKRHALELFNMLKTQADAVYHLSTYMCPAHRQHKLAEIKEKLTKGQPLILISTSLIEAGVDIDFPVVYRASSGLDSLVQAAGRCNRENKLEHGQVYVFKNNKNDSYLQPAIDSFNAVERYFKEDLLSLEAINSYFNNHYLKDSNFDSKEIMAMLEYKGNLDFSFAKASANFKLIEEIDGDMTIYIPMPEIKAILQKIKYQSATKQDYRQLAKYSITIHQKLFARLQELKFLELLNEKVGVYALTEVAYNAYYHNEMGLNPNPDNRLSNEDLNI